MPYKLRNSRRHKFKKARYKITNWSQYNQALINRGSITLWLSPDIIRAWHPRKRKQKLQGGQFKYSDIAIEAAITIKTVYHLPYRATQGLLESIMSLMNLKIAVPHYSRICRRARILEITELANINNDEHLNIIIDSTGLKIFGAGLWHEEKHGLKKRREWRKLHLVIDRSSQAIIAQELTTYQESDPATVDNLLNQITGEINSVTADGAYNTNEVYDSIVAHAKEDVVIAIPPQINSALFSINYMAEPTKRDHNILFAEKYGKYRWQDYSDYNYRSLVETTMFRYKKIIGESLFSRNFGAQKVESKIACHVLNKMTALGMPISERIKVAA